MQIILQYLYIFCCPYFTNNFVSSGNLSNLFITPSSRSFMNITNSKAHEIDTTPLKTSINHASFPFTTTRFLLSNQFSIQVNILSRTDTQYLYELMCLLSLNLLMWQLYMIVMLFCECLSVCLSVC